MGARSGSFLTGTSWQVDRSGAKTKSGSREPRALPTQSHIGWSMQVDAGGWAIDANVTIKSFPALNHGKMTVIDGIIVHQTDAPTLQATFNSYGTSSPNGAHFLIDKDRTIYQTGSIFWKLWHVGKLRPRCLLENKCSPVETKDIRAWHVNAVHKAENAKSYPARFPSNDDSIGIELVGATLSGALNSPFEAVTDQQNLSLRWLISQLKTLLKVPMMEVFRHPDVSYKNLHEAETAKW